MKQSIFHFFLSIGLLCGFTACKLSTENQDFVQDKSGIKDIGDAPWNSTDTDLLKSQIKKYKCSQALPMEKWRDSIAYRFNSMPISEVFFFQWYLCTGFKKTPFFQFAPVKTLLVNRQSFFQGLKENEFVSSLVLEWLNEREIKSSKAYAESFVRLMDRAKFDPRGIFLLLKRFPNKKINIPDAEWTLALRKVSPTYEPIVNSVIYRETIRALEKTPEKM